MIKIGDMKIDNHDIPEIADFTYDDTEFQADLKMRAITVLDPLEGEFTCEFRVEKSVWAKLTGLWQWAYENCPNKRVRHLMQHGKNGRVQWKNFKRAIHEIAKVLDKKGAVIV